MMPLLNLMQTQLLLAKNRNIAAATRFLTPLLRCPMTQVVISFVVGYFATIKITQICTLIRKQVSKRQNLEECVTQLDSESGSSEAILIKGQAPTDDEALWLTSQQLTAYNGLQGNNEPIYTALNGKIYDLSSSRDVCSKPGLYSLLAGCNANQVLNIACGSMGVCTDDVVQRWEQSLNAEFNIIGYLIDSDVSDDDLDANTEIETETETVYNNDRTVEGDGSQEELSANRET
ncbi:uncharacterized protein LOC132795001 isoform X2 [Drosophila nasuta]|uniref:uncharacterized protein LOC132795001 isoform X2 n=1 Tax=Drosophila nasuta TaxID=42062 RepID=UPI00295EC7A5|nr:uncharacterized protein LOC132795001 isoform X2 [Drosophila nasuta]